MPRNLQEIRAQMKRLVEEANFQYKVLTRELQKNIIETYYNIINEYDSNKWDPVDFYDNPDSVDLFLEILEYGYLDWRNVLPKDIVNILFSNFCSNFFGTSKFISNVLVFIIKNILENTIYLPHSLHFG